MKGKLVAFAAILCIASLIASGANAKGKPVKPDKPGEPGNTTAECIVFTGDLETAPGSEVVESCCPNAGPFPEYGMILDLHDEYGNAYGGDYDGQLFINGYGAGRDHRYIVQFWNDDICFEIIGGVIDNDKKNKVLTVTFDEQATFCEYDVDGTSLTTSLPVSFMLQRTSDLSYCQ